jgi:hypothetical protein
MLITLIVAYVRGAKCSPFLPLWKALGHILLGLFIVAIYCISQLSDYGILPYLKVAFSHDSSNAD